jgi:hypothetical protein
MWLRVWGGALSGVRQGAPFSNCGWLRKLLRGRQLISLPDPLFSPGLEQRPPHDVGRFGRGEGSRAAGQAPG